MNDNRLGGYVRLYRKILDNPAFRDAGEAMFFAYLVLLANWKAGERRYDERVYKLERGQLVIGQRKLAQDYGCSHKKVRTVVHRLNEEYMIDQIWTQHGAQRAPVITICNYDDYQIEIGEGAQERAQGGHKVGTPKNKGNKGNSYTVDFDEFWRVYPGRKPHSNPKKTANQKFELALTRGASAADIARGARNYAVYVERERVDPKFVAQAVTWLNQERWTEYQEPPPDPRPVDDGFL